ncbi:putative membrane protein DUF2306 [Pedobacter metabolipauper]|uniref:Putative membrane protein DUF2306 n=2 Tax=Pedobacter metabolipauper TaxID=425513 RepID=A0A4R6SZB8_9SPHI|nr:putative membrane protein DUF2306 [Pedobacter metabolipauper]
MKKMQKNIMTFSAGVKKTSHWLWYIALLYFSYLMLLITLQYVPINADVAFLRVKTDVTGLWYYNVAFFTHVYSSMFVLLAGIIQFSSFIRTRFIPLHRWSGRVYVAVIICISGPSGLIMGFYGNGGWIGQLAFCLLAMLWIWFTWKGFFAILSGDLILHKAWMYRSYALTLSAISLRLWKFVLVYLFEPKPMDLYQLVAWLGWTGNLVIAEVFIYFTIGRLYRKRKSIVI